jgi:DNA (cytosine-5)-methyltransferase 1
MAKRTRRLALSLFSGAGGMDIGIRQAGFEVVATLEIDPHCCETLRHNLAREGHNTLVIEDDVREVDPDALRKKLKLRPKRLDLLFGGPPCQSFSQIGKQEGLEDERGPLLFQMSRFARVFEPKAILIEQVKGLLSAKDASGKRGGVLEHLLQDLDSLGYEPKWRVLNAAEYGVPQLRQRVFIVATPKPNGFRYPDATHSAENPNGPLFPTEPYRTVGDVLGGLGRTTRNRLGPRTDSHIDVTTDRDRERIADVPEGSYLAKQLHLPKSIRGNLGPKDTTKYLRLSRAEPSKTLRCGEIFFHPTASRYLTPREYMRIHGYPDDYELVGPIRSRSGRVRNLDQHRQVANSVPPPLAHAIAEQILEVI